MKRSEINAAIRDAEDRFSKAGFFLPEWGHWSRDEWIRYRDSVSAIFEAGLGWDLTDFGHGQFAQQGLLLFTVRNGTPAPDSRLPYAEKLMVVREKQLTPMHFHWHKTEDIINRGGGELVIELYMADRDSESTADETFKVYRDGICLECGPGEQVRLDPGQSITLTPYLYHAFWAEGDTCIVGEVSSVNDDAADNRFLEDIGRFPEIEEDEPPYRLLCTEYKEIQGA